MATYTLTYVPLPFSEHVTITTDEGTRKLRRDEEWTRSGRVITIRDAGDAFSMDGPWRVEVQYAYAGTTSGLPPEDDGGGGGGGGGGVDPGGGDTVTTSEILTMDGRSMQFRVKLRNEGNHYLPFDLATLGFVYSCVTYGEISQTNEYTWDGSVPPLSLLDHVWRGVPSTVPASHDLGFTHRFFISALGLITEETGNAYIGFDTIDVTGSEGYPEEPDLTELLTTHTPTGEGTWEARLIASGSLPTGSNVWLFVPNQLESATLGDSAVGLANLGVRYDADYEGEVVFGEGSLMGPPDFGTGTAVDMGVGPDQGTDGDWVDISGMMANAFETWNGFFVRLRALIIPETWDPGLGGNTNYDNYSRRPLVQIRRTLIWEAIAGGGGGGEGGPLTLTAAYTGPAFDFIDDITQFEDASDATFTTAVDGSANDTPIDTNYWIEFLWNGITETELDVYREISAEVRVRFRFPGGSGTLHLAGYDNSVGAYTSDDTAVVADTAWHEVTMDLVLVVGWVQDFIFADFWATAEFEIAEVEVTSWGITSPPPDEVSSLALTDVDTNAGATPLTPISDLTDASDATYFVTVKSASSDPDDPNDITLNLHAMKFTFDEVFSGVDTPVWVEGTVRYSITGDLPASIGISAYYDSGMTGTTGTFHDLQTDSFIYEFNFETRAYAHDGIIQIFLTRSDNDAAAVNVYGIELTRVVDTELPGAG